MRTIPLSELELNSTGIIQEINCHPSIKRRLLDLGLIPGTKITPVLVSPFGEPTAFEFRNTIISIRDNDCSFITIKTK